MSTIMASDEKPVTFKIGELSKLYHIGVDSIRYYEKVGILNPIRDEENNYRLYTTDDVRKLTMIRELLGLDFTTEQIKEFEANRSIENTKALLEKELQLVNNRIKELQQKKKNITSRLNTLTLAEKEIADEVISLVHLPERKIYILNEDRIPDSYVNYYLIQQMHETNSKMDTIAVCDCYVLDVEHSRPESDYLWTKAVFFHSDTIKLPTNDHLPEGNYLTLSFHGSDRKTKPLVKKMFDYAAEHGYTILGHPLEFCRIDDYETAIEEEFLTTLQLQVQI